MFLSSLVATAIAFSCLDLSRKYIILAPYHKERTQGLGNSVPKCNTAYANTESKNLQNNVN